MRSSGVDFSSGVSFKVSINEFEIQRELGKGVNNPGLYPLLIQLILGQYGIVSKVLHIPSKVTMAMKQIRLDISEAAFKQILIELEVLHKSSSQFIVEFYGAFFVESCVYYCMEYMDAGSLDKLYHVAVDETVLGKMAFSVRRNWVWKDILPLNFHIR